MHSVTNMSCSLVYESDASDRTYNTAWESKDANDHAHKNSRKVHVKRSFKWYDLNRNWYATFFVKFFIIEIHEAPLSGARAHREVGKGAQAAGRADVRTEPLLTDTNKLQRPFVAYEQRICATCAFKLTEAVHQNLAVAQLNNSSPSMNAILRQLNSIQIRHPVFLRYV
jgi:hypothetical protein